MLVCIEHVLLLKVLVHGLLLPSSVLMYCTWCWCWLAVLSLEECVDGLFLSKKKQGVNVDQDEAVASCCHVDVGFRCAAVKSNLLKNFCQVFLPCFWVAT